VATIKITADKTAMIFFIILPPVYGFFVVFLAVVPAGLVVVGFGLAYLLLVE
jgi:hypothetical protein